jgi:hypothetical protein
LLEERFYEVRTTLLCITKALTVHVTVCARGVRGTGNPDAKIRSAQMESNPREALRRLIIQERKMAADESSAARKKSEGVAWEGTRLSEAIRATEFVPRVSEEMQQCSGCRRRIPGMTELVWTTVFFPKRLFESSPARARTYSDE